ncbi:hypothetical protein EVAR_87395_1 [Eumeta japonica]|uniref:Uncharacterized protein n=1 Tax=Eumeta variegata TaxID=151549 RepID=A0A4C1Y3Y4_EUMVA|nr:hypothetical protein EVAR_87395_1 [Eumeta japonica]
MNLQVTTPRNQAQADSESECERMRVGHREMMELEISELGKAREEFSDDDDTEYRIISAKKEIQQDLSGDEELQSQVAASVRLMEAAMGVDHEKLLSGDLSFK